MKISTCLLIFLACFFLLKNVSAQDKKYEPKDPKPYQTIVHTDSTRLQNYQTFINCFQAVFAATPDLRRQLIPGTLEVYPVPGLGAIEIGAHRFIHVENGQTQTGVYQFIHTWQFKGGERKVTRVVSAGH